MKPCYDTKRTNPIIARAIFELFQKTKTWVTPKQIQQWLLSNSQHAHLIESVYLCLNTRTGKEAWTREDVPFKFVAHFGQLLPIRTYKHYFELQQSDPNKYRPSPQKIHLLEQIFAIGDFEDKNIDEYGAWRKRITDMGVNIAPTSDPVELDLRVNNITAFGNIPQPLGNEQPQKVHVETTTVFQRDPVVKAWILQQAGDKCERCNNPSPFNRADGSPYLEVHHVRPLALGGADITTNAVALCPNCHRHLHHGWDADQQTRLLYLKVSRLVPI